MDLSNIPFKGRGLLIPVYIVVSFIVIKLISELLEQYVGGIFSEKYDSMILIGLSLIIAGIWTYFTSEDFIEVKGKKELIDLQNEYIFLPMKMWSYFIFGFGILMLVGGILESIS